LTHLPPEIGQLQNLQELNLQANQLTHLPPQIGQLRNLQTLWLNSNRLTHLPPEIGQLKNLQYLVLSHNQLTHLLPEIGQLQNLRTLDLSRTSLMHLPSEIGQLQNLQWLTLHDTPLTHLPLEVEQLQNLQTLRLSSHTPMLDLLPLTDHPNVNLSVSCWGVELKRRYWTHPDQWKAEWLLTETNAEVRKVLIEKIGYDRICQELQATERDAWREYTLLKIDREVDVEPIYVLKMTCPSTAHIHTLRVPPYLTSAREAIKWTNWGIDPEAFAAET
jgi:hypothetical protein